MFTNQRPWRAVGLLALVVVWACLATHCYAAPTISNAVATPDSLVITGSGFGNKTTDWEWSGLWTTPDGVDPGDVLLWDFVPPARFGTWRKAYGHTLVKNITISSDHRFDLNHYSIRGSICPPDDPDCIYGATGLPAGDKTINSAFWWDGSALTDRVGAAGDTLFVSYRQYIEPQILGIAPSQMKLIRINDQGSCGADFTGDWVMSVYVNEDQSSYRHGFGGIYANLGCTWSEKAVASDSTYSTIPGSIMENLEYNERQNGVRVGSSAAAIRMNQWYRNDVTFVNGHGSAHDGAVIWHSQRDGEPRYLRADAFDIMTWGNDACHQEQDLYQPTVYKKCGWEGSATAAECNDPSPANSVVWHNYSADQVPYDSAGNPIYPTIPDKVDFYTQDIYIGIGTNARVEVGNAATYAACTKLAIQPAKSWTNGSITTYANLGAFTDSEELYAFVICAEDTISAGRVFTNVPDGPTKDLGTVEQMLYALENFTASRYYSTDEDSSLAYAWKYVDPSTGRTMEFVLTDTLSTTAATGTYTTKAVSRNRIGLGLGDALGGWQWSEWIDQSAGTYRVRFASPSRDGQWDLKHLVKTEASDWLNPAWTARRTVAADTSLVPAVALTNIPIVLYLDKTNMDSSFWSNVKSRGEDLRFTTSDGTTLVPHEIVYYEGSSANPQAEVWLRIPSLSKAANTFYVYYGNPAASSASTSAVWSEYEAVYHYQQIPGSTAQLIDSSPAGNNASTDYDQFDERWQYFHRVNGKIGKGWRYAEGRNARHLTLATDDANWTLSVWAKVNEDGSNYVFQGNGRRTNGVREWFSLATPLTFDSEDKGDIVFDPYGLSRARSVNVMDFDTWEHIVFAMDAANGTLRVYRNGTAVTWQGGFPADFIPTTIDCAEEAAGCGIGSQQYNFSTDGMDGIVDEWQLRNGAVSATWALTSYRNQANPLAFWSLGSVVAGPSGSTGRQKYPQVTE